MAVLLRDRIPHNRSGLNLLQHIGDLVINIRQAVESKGYILPQAPMPVGSYQATLYTDNFLYISGQLPVRNGELIYKGCLGKELTTDQGKAAAQLCALNFLSQLDGSLRDRKLKQVVKVEGYINASSSFTEHAEVLNGASDFL
ncbi:MAG: RidA family protein [Sneathiella sp.]|nr:RidA family protein [Sneathiella sp.]